jgi:hypothetical protein
MTTQVKRDKQQPQPQPQPQEPYSEPLVTKHEPLRDITGTKYGEKVGFEKAGAEV